MNDYLKKWLTKPYLALAYSLLILYLCVTPSENLPDDVDDKLAHLLAFGGVGFLYYFLGKRKLILILMAILFGVSIEFIQGALPTHFYRGFELMDMVYDGMGAILGGLVSSVFDRIFLKP